MKTIYVVRHAKSSWDFPALPDHDRPLLEKGKKRTKKVIDYLLKQSIQLDFVISSSAVRASETADYIARALGYDSGSIKYDPSLYHADSEMIFEQFLDLNDEYKSLMLVGHNPALTNFVNNWLKPPIDWLPTSAVVCLEFSTDHWDELRHAPAKLNFIVFPKLIKGQ
ncbi:MAG: histidine phosphatase family protein [Bacteroidetes bacterium]|nr:histidine phosphatase family protein [Bacteroidota bacterium]MBU1577956.1 histidine phosphatase family protein [Bacteroidota bacterium]MBU2465681.1 histidine phosphatase family protein [Bacteroidota bacterium]MBU2556922.1 histidine phosphatase family protein [Bacteroidota bacterium]